ncbi:MAG: adenylate/guanylate cyclase domain-containing protein [Streptosporangiaceae bacterium]
MSEEDTVRRPTPEEIDEALLGGARRYTRQEVAQLAGVRFEYARRLWQAMGFAELPDDVVAFTDGDLAALRKGAELLESEIIDEELGIRLTRALGQTMARLAEWQVDMLVDALLPSDRASSGGSSPDDAAREAVEVAEWLVPELEPLLAYVWRRQLAASGTRALAAAGAELGPTRTRLAVGFADLVSFTRLSRELDADGLAAVVEGYESAAADIVAEQGGRLVKTVGDEVLFVAERPEAAAEVGLRLAETVRDTEPPVRGGAHAEPPVRGGAHAMPPVRVGVAYGQVVLRMGDVYGTTVNLASRLTSFAKPGTVLVDHGAAEELRETYRLTRIRRRQARGLGSVQPYVLRRVSG